MGYLCLILLAEYTIFLNEIYLRDMDSLIEIPKSELPTLRELYRAHWPSGVEGYCLLNTQILYPALTEFFQFKFYCPEGKIANGMVAISDKVNYRPYKVLF